MKTENTTFEKVNNWIRNSVTLKLFMIVMIMLLLLIPTEMIKSIISEREDLRNQAIREVSSMWAEEQLLNGPVLVIPVLYEDDTDNKKSQEIKYLKILPEELQISGTILPTTLKRGIYEVIVYRSVISVHGAFDLNENFNLNDAKKILDDQAFITFGISDLRGIEDEIKLKWQGQNLKVNPGSELTDLISSGVTVNIPDISINSVSKYDFQIDLNLQGSQNISFIPLGNITQVDLESTWPSPSFRGKFLPDQREINNDGFKAYWKILQLNRNFPQSWIGSSQSQNILDAAFGVNLILPVDDYQKSMRSSKYAVMTIALTFLIFFLVEILSKRKIHPFQYGLVGLALSLFYILLVSISEQSNFNLAYILSSVIIIAMISLYSLSVFKAIKLSSILLATLISIYGFLFVTLQLADYALLLGSIGLTVILGFTMYFTRNINWYKLNIENE
jgi:inner membrane protein